MKIKNIFLQIVSFWVKIVVSAPGKLIISGEHSVLHGYSAISMAIKQRLEVEITELKDAKKKTL